MLKDHGIERQDVIKQHESLYGKDVSPKVPKTWIFNDFGPVAIRYFKDLNNNGKLDGRETLSGEMFHTTPDNEAEYAQKLPVRLYPSHGCIHLKPTDRDKLFSIGAFKRGTLFTVHKYTERFTGSIK
ncbi:L,D-transpeptidase [Litoribacillus peritrichatus]|uniref:L,D-TPase catalytic domain-containing protein n=1 Tax=Litoribacillus peritrichatus TaxID=718191 RepID=A0ABP7M7I1_9GAMM